MDRNRVSGQNGVKESWVVGLGNLEDNASLTELEDTRRREEHLKMLG